MPADKKTILINGGRRLKLSTDMSENNKGVRFTKDADGNWNIVITTRIQSGEAKDAIYKFTDLEPKIPEGKTIDNIFPNMVFLTALDDEGNPADMSISSNSEFIPSFDKTLGGTITIKINLLEMGKTENKTENPET